MDAYANLRGLVAGTMATWKAGAVTLTRRVPGPPANPQEPWTPGPPVETTYDLDAVARGVAGDYADGTLVFASDLMVVVSPKARLAGAAVDLVPGMTDTLTIDGAVKVIKQIKPAPASGDAAVFRIFVA